jgi:hypothetical protein
LVSDSVVLSSDPKHVSYILFVLCLGKHNRKKGERKGKRKLGEGEGEGDEENEEFEDEEDFGHDDYAQVHANFCAFVTISTDVQNVTLFLKYCWSLHSCSPKLWLWVRFSLKKGVNDRLLSDWGKNSTG